MALCRSGRPDRDEVKPAKRFGVKPARRDVDFDGGHTERSPGQGPRAAGADPPRKVLQDRMLRDFPRSSHAEGSARRSQAPAASSDLPEPALAGLRICRRHARRRQGSGRACPAIPDKDGRSRSSKARDSPSYIAARRKAPASAAATVALHARVSGPSYWSVCGRAGSASIGRG